MTESDFEFQPTREQSENWTAMKQQRQAIRQQAAGDGTQQDDRGGNMERQSMLLSNHSGVRLGGKLYNLAISFAVFLILFCGACGIIVAAETGNFFSHQLDQAILPLFSMAQFVSELDLFSSLTDKVGQVGDPGALP
eukprot:CAMPEP_0117084860 /NCGR_PEP_ID=MMETSP0472-20121206/59712_1 /TAXON_ID=693140 ORGANISM="Tiarina fusus, Strain LIS" /NCGR_SAMPLE_ID=MMETSP0472 /ASSEMBLY_ACC=CAM_ASM_000603 /LENGTH=136 /DNA_ID=CAMNT_0004813995 /DNA_START=66 /DNA_END=472 /DNA_ORIENTATION=+